MIRFLLAFALVFCSLTSIAAQPQATGLRLMVFKGPGPNGGPCKPCDEFNRDFDRIPGFAAGLKRQFELVPSWDYRKTQHHGTFAEYNVKGWPTFLVTDQSGQEVARVTGYDGSKELWRQLTSIQPERTPQSRTEPLRSDVLNQLRNANESLQEERDTLRDKIGLIESDLQRQRQRADAIAKRTGTGTEEAKAEIDRQLAEAKAEIDEKMKQLRREQDQLRDLHERQRARSDPVTEPVTRPTVPLTIPPVSGATLEMECKDGICELPQSSPQAATESDTVSGWKKVGGWVAMTAITLAAPQFAIPGSIGLTAAGFGLNWIRNRKKKGASHRTVDGRNGVRTDTVYVTKRIDYEAEQIREALRRVARRHEQTPNAMALIREVDAVAEQLIHGQQVIHEDNQQ